MLRRDAMKRKQSSAAAFETLLRRARLNEARKHHLVPASYLRRWASNNIIRVTDLREDRTYVTAPERAARKTDFYRAEAEGIDPHEIPPLLFETLLSDVEKWGKDAIDEFLRGQRQFDPELGAQFAWFLAFQLTRGTAQRREMRFMANEIFKLRYANLTDDGIRRLLMERGKEPTPAAVADMRHFLDRLRDGSITVMPPEAALVGYTGQSAAEVGKYLMARRWIVCRTPPFLVTCDEPVVPVGGPGCRRDERAGVATAGMIFFPLSPDRLLVLMRNDLAAANGISPYQDGSVLYTDLDYAETVGVCREIVMNASRWAFERPQSSVASRFEIPTLHEPAGIETVGRIQEGDKEGTLLRTFRVSRWAHRYAPSPWPLDRWWPPGWTARRDSRRRPGPETR